MWSIKKGIKQILNMPQDTGEKFFVSVDEEPLLGNLNRTFLRGWALDADQLPVSLIVRFDGAAVAQFRPQHGRLDVFQFHSDNPYSLTAGYQIPMPMDLLPRIEAGRLEVFTNSSVGERKIWEWGGVEAEFDYDEFLLSQGIDPNIADVPREPASLGEVRDFYTPDHAFRESDPEVFRNFVDGTPSGCTVVLRTHGGVDGRAQRIVEALQSLGAPGLKLTKIIGVTEQESEIETLHSIVKRAHVPRGVPVEIVSENAFPGWRELSKDVADPRSELVCYIDDRANTSYLDFEALASSFCSFPAVRVLMASPFGASRGSGAAPGYHLGDLNANSSTPLFYVTSEISPVWLSSLSFLISIEPASPPKSGDRVSLPPSRDAFAYHLDLLQPCPCDDSFGLVYDERQAFFLQQSLREHIPFCLSIAADKESFLFVLPEVSNQAAVREERVWKSGYRRGLVELAEKLREAGHPVVFVQDGEGEAPFMVGDFTPVSFSEIGPHSGLMGSGYVFAVGAGALSAASVLRYMTGYKLGKLYLEDEVSGFSELSREKGERAETARSADLLPIYGSPKIWSQISESVLHGEFALHLPIAFDSSSPENYSVSEVVQSLRKAFQKFERNVDSNRSERAGVSIVVPVFGALDAVMMCVRGIDRHLPATCEVILVNDGSDREVSAWLSKLEQESPRFRVIHREKNGGFIEACYTGLEASNSSHDLVFLNSDVVLTAGSIEGLQNAAYSRSNVALASPLSTGSPHFQVQINPGDTLDGAAACIREVHSPLYPTAITPEGQCLYVRRFALNALGFFDRVFDRGFCEESDLSMRYFLNGLDMVVADDVLIHHQRSASFSKEGRTEQYGRNRPIFDGRWKRYYSKAYEEFLRRDVVAEVKRSYAALRKNVLPPVGQFTLEELEHRIEKRDALTDRAARASRVSILGEAEVVFILSSIMRGGGALSVLQHVNELIQRGVKATVLSLREGESTDFPLLAAPIEVSVDQLFELDWSTQKVIATYWSTSYLVHELTRRHPKLSGYYYVQDYEPWFYPKPLKFKTVQRAEQSYELGLPCVAKTEFLREVVKKHHGVDVQLVTPGISRGVFYPGEQEQHLGRPRFSALFRPRTPRRGASELCELTRELIKRVPEIEVRFFGDVEFLPEDLEARVALLGSIPQSDVGKLYRESDILIDMSHWHGFGRMGIESMSCGVVPVLSRSGGIDRYAEHGVNSLLYDVGDEALALEHVVRLAKDRAYRLQLREKGLATAARFSEERAIDDWMKIWGMGISEESRVPMPGASFVRIVDGGAGVVDEDSPATHSRSQRAG